MEYFDITDLHWALSAGLVMGVFIGQFWEYTEYRRGVFRAVILPVLVIYFVFNVALNFSLSLL